MRPIVVLRRSAFFAGLVLLSASSLFSQSSATALDRGIRLFEAGEHAEAKQVLLPYAQQNPRDARAAFYVGQIFRRERDIDRAVEWHERAVRLEPTSSDYHLHLAGVLGDRAQSANAVRQAMLARRAKSHLDDAVRLNPESIEARFGLVQFYTMAPGVMGGSKQKARQEAEEIRRRNAYRGALAAGMVHESEKNFAAAETEYRNVLRQHPDSVALYYRIASAAAQQEHYDRAFEALETAVRRRPAELGAMYQIGRLSAMTGQRLDRGEAALRAYLQNPARNGPSPAAAHWRLGMIHEKQGQPERARTEYRTALRLDPAHREAQAALRKLGG